MKINLRLLFCALMSAFVFLSISNVSAQDKSDRKNRDFCSGEYYSNGDRAQFKEVRETTIGAGNLLEVDGKRNGGIKVRGENRSDILVRACVQTTGDTEETARALAKNIRVETDSVIRAENSTDESNWSVSYEIIVPRSTNLKLSTQNGGININSVEGTMEFEAHNGGVSLNNVAGDVKGKTTNGGVAVALSGNGWKGAGLDVETRNGGVVLTIPENYAAHVETGTINGGFRSEISQLSVNKDERRRGTRLSTDLNGGGAPIRVVTTNGGIVINSSER